jgi:hypothetical protein
MIAEDHSQNRLRYDGEFPCLYKLYALIARSDSGDIAGTTEEVCGLNCLLIPIDTNLSRINQISSRINRMTMTKRY